jgi:hypothetical protein
VAVEPGDAGEAGGAGFEDRGGVGFGDTSQGEDRDSDFMTDAAQQVEAQSPPPSFDKGSNTGANSR